jgi:hypothetical protein
MIENQRCENLTVDQRKILKLFNYTSWEEYIKWIDEKIE